MRFYSEAEMGRTMKVQDVILRALAKRMSWWQAAEILGISARQMRRWKQRYEEYGYDGLYDRRRRRPSPRRVGVETVEQVLSLYREQYFDFNGHLSRMLCLSGVQGSVSKRISNIALS